VVEPIAPARFKVQFTASAELRDKLCRAKALLRHKDPDADLSETIDEAVTLLLGKLEAKRFGKTKTPRKALADTDTSASSRYVPAAVRRVVFDRDQGRCAYVDEATGRRCSCTDPGKLEYHHLTPFALGCDHDPNRVELRCRAHNQYQAELDFGPETMQRYRTGTCRAREPRAAYDPVTVGIEPRAAPHQVAKGAGAEVRAPRGSPAPQPVVWAPRVADRRGGAGVPTRSLPPRRRAPRRGGPSLVGGWCVCWSTTRLGPREPRLSPSGFRSRRFVAGPRAGWDHERCARQLEERAAYAAISIPCGLTDLY